MGSQDVDSTPIYKWHEQQSHQMEMKEGQRQDLEMRSLRGSVTVKTNPPIPLL